MNARQRYASPTTTPPACLTAVYLFLERVQLEAEAHDVRVRLSVLWDLGGVDPARPAVPGAGPDGALRSSGVQNRPLRPRRLPERTGLSDRLCGDGRCREGRLVWSVCGHIGQARSTGEPAVRSSKKELTGL